MIDNRQVHMVTRTYNYFQHQTRELPKRKGLGFFGWLGVAIWAFIALVVWSALR